MRSSYYFLRYIIFAFIIVIFNIINLTAINAIIGFNVIFFNSIFLLVYVGFLKLLVLLFWFMKAEWSSPADEKNDVIAVLVAFFGCSFVPIEGVFFHNLIMFEVGGLSDL